VAFRHAAPALTQAFNTTSATNAIDLEKSEGVPRCASPDAHLAVPRYRHQQRPDVPAHAKAGCRPRSTTGVRSWSVPTGIKHRQRGVVSEYLGRGHFPAGTVAHRCNDDPVCAGSHQGFCILKWSALRFASLPLYPPAELCCKNHRF
jgi:hypothetical protein